MKRTYTLFIATEELLKNQSIRLFAKLHAFQLSLRQPQTFTIIIPIDTQTFDLDRACVVYEPELVHLHHATIQRDGATLYLTVTLEARDIGSTRLSVVVPDVPMPALPSLAEHVLHTDGVSLETKEGTYKKG